MLLQDDLLTFGRFDFLKLRDYDGVKELISQGYHYGARLVERGDMEPVFGSVRHGFQLGEPHAPNAGPAH